MFGRPAGAGSVGARPRERSRARRVYVLRVLLRGVDDADKLPVFGALTFELHKSVFLGE